MAAVNMSARDGTQLRLVVITGVGAGCQRRVVNEHFQIVILVGAIRARRIEGKGVEGAGILNTTVDLGCHIVVRADDAPAGLDGKDLQAEVGEIHLRWLLYPFQKILVEKRTQIGLPQRNAVDGDARLAQPGGKLNERIEILLLLLICGFNSWSIEERPARPGPDQQLPARLFRFIVSNIVERLERELESFVRAPEAG